MSEEDMFELRSDGELHCESLAEALSAYVDNSVAEQERMAIESHLRTCPDCTRMVEQLRALAGELANLARVEPPGHIWRKITDATGGGAARKSDSHAVPTRVGVWSLIPGLLLRLYDGDLAHRLSATGSCREQAGGHGAVSLLAAVALVTPAVMGVGALRYAALLGIPLMWLASTRLETRLSTTQLLLLLIGSAAGPVALQLSAAATMPPLALAACLTALAILQWSSLPRLRPRMLGVGVPIAARGSAMLLIAVALSRPDIAGAAAAAPLASGVLCGFVAHRLTHRAA